VAENQDGQERSEDPSGKRLSDARSKGQVPRSRELNSVAMLLLGGVALIFLIQWLGEGLWGIMRANLAPSRSDLFDPGAPLRHLSEAAGHALLMVGPFLLLMAVVAIVASVALGGFNMSSEVIQPKLSKLNPLAGLKRLVSPKGAVELLKSLAKFLLVAAVLIWLLWRHKDQLLDLSYQELGPALASMQDMLSWCFVVMAATLLLVAALDVPFQLWDHKQQLKMTKQEVRDEHKQTDGNPEIRARIRNMQREIAFRRMMHEVPKADVIVTNPTHYAVALRYEQTRMRAPILVAKGADLIAANIRRVGTEAGVPVVESPVLARALYHSTELGAMIPQGLYLAVARLLAYVFQLKAYRRGGGEPPLPPELPVPEDLRHV
jgi:flagellar biosynthesis protein FlhB